MGKAYVHTVIDDHSHVAYAEIHDDEAALTAAAVLVRAVEWFNHRGSPSSKSCPTTAAPTAHTCGETPATSWASSTSAQGRIGPRPAARSSAPTEPWPTAGPTPAPATTSTSHPAKHSNAKRLVRPSICPSTSRPPTASACNRGTDHQHSRLRTRRPLRRPQPSAKPRSARPNSSAQSSSRSSSSPASPPRPPNDAHSKRCSTTPPRTRCGTG